MRSPSPVRRLLGIDLQVIASRSLPEFFRCASVASPLEARKSGQSCRPSCHPCAQREDGVCNEWGQAATIFDTQSFPSGVSRHNGRNSGRAIVRRKPYDLRCPVGSRACNAVLVRRRAMLRVTFQGQVITRMESSFIPPIACLNKFRRNLQLTRGVSALPLGGCAWPR